MDRAPRINSVGEPGRVQDMHLFLFSPQSSGRSDSGTCDLRAAAVQRAGRNVSTMATRGTLAAAAATSDTYVCSTRYGNRFVGCVSLEYHCFEFINCISVFRLLTKNCCMPSNLAKRREAEADLSIGKIKGNMN